MSSPVRNVRLDIEYDGTRYAGWQRQENGPSIQAEIEDTLAKVLQEPITLLGAGRTDAGVHARGQVANFHTHSTMSADRIQAALNGLLPDDIVLHAVAEVSPDFHARYSAAFRRYSYSISTAPTALQRNAVWQLRYALDLGLMEKAAAVMLGDHDYRSFCRAGAEVDHHRCIVDLSQWSVEGPLLRYNIRANRFLHGMVRAIVGTMVDIGRGYRPFEDLQVIFDSGRRTEAGPAAPARGLVLEEVGY